METTISPGVLQNSEDFGRQGHRRATSTGPRLVFLIFVEQKLRLDSRCSETNPGRTHQTYGDGSIPIITIFGGITIYSPAILEYLGYQGLAP
jgi:hypothetical protein